MKTLIAVLLGLAFSTANGQQSLQLDSQKVSRASEPKYVMKQYWFVMLIKGARRNQDSATAVKIQEGHMANINRLAVTGKLVLAGPFGDEGNWRGILVLDCEDQEEAEKLLQSDPAISSGRLSYEIHPWWTMKNEVFK